MHWCTLFVTERRNRDRVASDFAGEHSHKIVLVENQFHESWCEKPEFEVHVAIEEILQPHRRIGCKITGTRHRSSKSCVCGRLRIYNFILATAVEPFLRIALVIENYPRRIKIGTVKLVHKWVFRTGIPDACQEH